MPQGYFALLRHAILPEGPSGSVVLATLIVIVGLGLAFAFHAVRVRHEFDGEALFDLFRGTAIAALVVAAGVGIFAGGILEVIAVLGVPLVVGLATSAFVVHRRAAAAVSAGRAHPLSDDDRRKEVIVAAAMVVAGSLGVLLLPFVVLGIALS